MWLDLFECLGMPLKVDPARFLCSLPVLRGPSKKKNPSNTSFVESKRISMLIVLDEIDLVCTDYKIFQKILVMVALQPNSLCIDRHLYIEEWSSIIHQCFHSFSFITTYFINILHMEQMSECIVMGGWRLEGKARYGEIVRGERWEAEAVNRGRQELRVYRGMFW